MRSTLNTFSSAQYCIVNYRRHVQQIPRTHSSCITETLCNIFDEVNSSSRTCCYGKRPAGGSRGLSFGKYSRVLAGTIYVKGVRKVIPRACFCILKFPFIIVAGKGCVMIFREVALMQMTSGKLEAAIIH